MSIINHYVVSKATNTAGFISKTRLDKIYITFENGAKSPISIYKAKDLLYISPRTQKAIDKKIKQLITA